MTDEDLEALDPPAEESNAETKATEIPEGIEAENIIDLDDSNVRVVGGKENEPAGTEESLEL